MRNNKRRNIIIAGILMILVLCVSIGYAYLTKKLTINGVTDINKTSFIIYFDDAKESVGSVEATKELTIDEKKTTIDFGMTLNKPGDYYEFEVSTVNDGTIDAMIDTVETLGMNEENEKYITYTATYLDGSPIQHCDLLASNTREKIKVRVEYKDIENKEDLPTSDIDLTLELQLNYIQAEGCAVAPVGTKTISIDPNGGLYEGKPEIVEFKKETGDILDLAEPTKEGSTFIGWQLEDGTILDENTITISDKDLVIKAIWKTNEGNNERTITIDPNGGLYEGKPGIVEFKKETGDVLDLAEPTKEGSTFIGWQLENGIILDENTITIGDEDLVIKAVWKINEDNNERTITIDPNGGLYEGKPGIVEFKKETGDVLILSNPTKEGAEFAGWQLEDGTILDENTITIGDEDLVIKAVWKTTGEVVARIENTYYTTVQDAIDASVANDTIYLIKDTTESPNNTKQVTLDLQGHTIKGTMTNTNDITLVSSLTNKKEAKENGIGTIENLDATAFVNNGTLTLGVDDDTVEIDNISITSSNSKIALEQNGTFNFYDGYLEGKVGLAGDYDKTPVYSTSDESPIYYVPFVDHLEEKNCQKVYLSASAPEKAIVVEYVKPNLGIYFFNLQDAINTSVVKGLDMFALRSFEAAYSLIVNENESTLFDISGFNVDFGNEVLNNGTLKIKNSNHEQGKLDISVEIVNNGTLNIDEIKIEQTTSANIIDNSGTINIKNSTLTAKDGYVIYNKVGTTLTLDKNTYLSSNNIALYNNSTEELTIDGGNIKGIYNEGILKIESGIYNKGILKVIVSEHSIGYDAGSIFNKKTLIVNGGTIESTISSKGLDSETIINGGEIYVENSDVFDPKETKYASSAGVLVRDGTLIITGGLIKAIIEGDGNDSNNAVGIGLEGGTATITGGTIEAIIKGSSSNFNSAMGISVSNGGNLIIDGNVTIKGIAETGRGIVLSKSEDKAKDPNLEIKSGNIYGSTYGLQINYGTATMGEKDGNVNISNPIIKGDLYGVYNKGIDNKVYFYDGILKGQTAGYNESAITATEDGTNIYKGTEVIEEDEYQTNYLIKQENFLRVDEVEYNSFAKAINAITNEGTITVIKSSTAVEEVIIPEGKDITLDLNNQELQFDSTITNNGNLTITDTSTEKKGKISNNKDSTSLINPISVITNNKKLKINNGLIQTSARYGNAIKNTKFAAEVIVNGGELHATYTGISGGTITMTGGVINAFNTSYPYIGIGIDGNGSVITINGGEINTAYHGILIEKNASYSTVTINGGVINSLNGIYFKRNGSITMTNGKINATNVGIETYDNLNMSGGEIHVENTNGSASAIKLNNVSGGTTSQITGGTIEAISKENGDAYGISIGFSTIIKGNVTIKGISETGTGYGIYTSGWNVKVISGTIYGSSYGIGKTGGILYIGEKGGNINTSDPKITGEKYGIYDTSQTILYFYDGILKGQEAGYFGSIFTVEDGTKIHKAKEEIDGIEYETTYLEAKENFVKVGETEYDSLVTAIDSIEKSGTIRVIASTIVEESVQFPPYKDITLDLNGHELQFSSTFDNSGTLTIDDTSADKKGKIINNTSTVIINFNKLIINNGIIQTTSDGAAVTASYDRDIPSELIVNGGEINATSTGIEAKGNTTYHYVSNVTINGGTINAGNKGIYISNMYSNVTMLDGEINANATGIHVYGGTFKMSGGEIHVETAENMFAIGIDLSDGTINITGGKIEAISKEGFTYGILTYSKYSNINISGDATIKGISETGTGIGLELNRLSNYKGIAEIKTGNIFGSTYGIDLKQGAISIGEKDSKVSISNPEIKGGLYGLYNDPDYNVSNSNEVYFYDGILKGQTAGYSGTINEINEVEDGTLIKEDTENIGEEEYKVTYLIKEDYIVVNETTSTQYKNLQTAINEASNKDTIKLLDDISLYYAVTIEEDKEITLDLDGHEIYTTKGITNKGNLTIKSEAENAIIKTVTAINLIENEGTLNMNNINLSNTATNDYMIYNKKGYATLDSININGNYGITNASGTITLNNTNINIIYRGIENSANLEMNGGTINIRRENYYGVYLSSTTENSIYENTTIEGTFYKNSDSETTIRNSTLSSVNLNSGSTNLTNNTINNHLSNNGTATINGGTISHSISQTEYYENYYNDFYLLNNIGILEINNAQMNVEGSTRNYYKNVIAINNTNILNMNSSTINLNGNGCSNTLYGIYNSGTSDSTLNSSHVIINNEDIFASPTNTSYGIYSQDADSKTTILSGEIINTASSTSYGIYINNGEVKIGEKEALDSPNYGTASASVSTESPLIKAIGKTTGIGVKKANGFFKFYDGKIIGSTEAKPDITSEVEYKYEAITHTDPENGYEYVILEYMKG